MSLPPVSFGLPHISLSLPRETPPLRREMLPCRRTGELPRTLSAELPLVLGCDELMETVQCESLFG